MVKTAGTLSKAETLVEASQEKTEHVPCPGRCGVAVEVQRDEPIESQRGQPTAPISSGIAGGMSRSLCDRGDRDAGQRGASSALPFSAP
jgi:anaerobic selenocysteine-containing dehydrogenase